MKFCNGDFISFVELGDILNPFFLSQNITAIQGEKSYDIIYSDEDSLYQNKHINPIFKPDWSPDNLLNRNYIKKSSLFRTSLINRLDIQDPDKNPSFEYDLLLKCSEKTSQIKHLSEVLYHQQKDNKTQHSKSAQEAITNALYRRGENGSVEYADNSEDYFRVTKEIKGTPLVSIIIPTKNMASILKQCIDSIINKSSYTNYEIILVDNGSTEKELFDLVSDYKKELGEKFNCYPHNIDFNFSKLVNYGAKIAKGQYLVLLNNDTEVISNKWIEAMLQEAQNPKTGAVGAKLLFHNNTIQHCGVIMGVGGISAHCFIQSNKDSEGYMNRIQSVTNYTAVTGACLMVSKEKYLEVGGFNEKLAVEFNDIDFCLQLLNAGYYNVYTPSAELYHYESLSRGTSDTSKRILKEINYMKKKWSKFIDRDPYYNKNLSLDFFDFRLKSAK